MRYIISYVLVIFLFVFFESCEESTSQVSQTSEHIIKDQAISKADSLDIQKKANKLREMFKTYHKRYAFNGNVLIAQKGKIIYEDSLGYLNFRKKEPLKLNTAFQLASVSKQFTAVAILQLVEKGLIDLNDSVTTFFPDFPYPGITVKLLLCHRSGLPNYTYFSELYVDKTRETLHNSEVMDMMIQYIPMKYYSPNRKYNYSNTGYVVLASIVEKVAGMTFENYIKENIFEPLDMKHSYVYIKGENDIEGKAIGYDSPRRIAMNDYLNGVVGDKGIYSTVEDLFKWDQGLYSGKIIKPEILEKAFIPYNPKMRKPKNYGFGWRIYTLPDGNVIYYHRGWWRGFQNLLVRIPQDSTTIVVLRNLKNRFHVDIQEIIKVLYPNGMPKINNKKTKLAV